MAKLAYDDFKHEYRLDGNVISGVTSCISSIPEDLLLNSAFIRKTHIGSLVHTVCDTIKQGEHVEIDSLGEEVKPYVEGYLKFRKEAGYTVLGSEVRVFSEKYRYGGCVDDISLNPAGRLAIMDIKTASIVSPTTKLQLAAYAGAVDEMGNMSRMGHGRVRERSCIWLLGDGDYKIIHYKAKEDFKVFLCHLTVNNWKRKEGLK
jgi:hypothetical protein